LKPTHFVPLTSTQTIPQFHTALTKPKVDGPRHDPTAPDAIVLPRPTMSQGVKAIDVVLDPNIVRHLRPHQREGVRFLYECVMGFKDFSGHGAILADEMGLGKTLTVIALIWTLLSTIPVSPY
jgi:DNA repair and recombination protein RAD54B